MNLQLNERPIWGWWRSGAMKRGRASWTRPTDLGSLLPHLPSFFPKMILAPLLSCVLMLHENPPPKHPRPAIVF
jgi:hypothetical protein